VSGDPEHVLAIDLGSRHVGWARFELRGGENPTAVPVAAGVWEIGNLPALKGSKNGKRPPRPADFAGVRWARLTARLTETLRQSAAQKVYFENVVARHASRLAAAGYFGSLAVLEQVCAGCLMNPVPVAVQEVKRFALGRGAGEKKEVIAAMQAAFPYLGPLAEDAADAVAIGGAGLTADGWIVKAGPWESVADHRIAMNLVAEGRRQPGLFMPGETT